MNCSTAIRAVVFATAMGLFAPAFADDGAKNDAAKSAPIETTQPEKASPDKDRDKTQAPIDLGFQTGPAPSPDTAETVPLPISVPNSALPSDAPIATSKPREAVSEALQAFDEVPEAAVSIAHIDIIVEDKDFSVRSRRTDSGGVLIEADPIFTHLKGKVSIEDTVLFYRRYQDGVTLSIDMATGEASINGQVRGFLPGWKGRDVADTWLGPNAIAFLTGTEPKEDALGRWTFTLSEQLRPQFDLDLWIEGEQITNPVVEPRTIGPVLLIPLEEVTTALGHTLERLENNVISVRRLQDSTTILLNLSNGLVAINNTPRGVTPNITFADAETLLLPFSAVETLTGTHIELEPGTDRINITLDDRLGGGVLPGERVSDEVAETDFTPESLDFQLSDRGPVTATFSSRYRGLNTQLQYESTGGFDNIRELQPSFVGLNVQSLSGWVGSIGDANTRLRELSGVGASRIRGVTFRQQDEKTGNILAVAAGARSTGSVAITEDASRPVFGGFVAGARVLNADRTQDIGIGLSIAPGGEAGRVVIGGQKSFANNTVEDSKNAVEGLFVSADTGLFYGPEGVKVDVRGRVQGRARVASQIGLQASLDYAGGNFRTSDQAIAEAGEDSVISQNAASSFNASASADWRSAKAWGPFSGIAAGVRTTHSRFGGNIDSASTSIGGSINGQVPLLGLNLSGDLNYITGNSANSEQTTSRTLNFRALKRFEWGNFTANYTDTDTSVAGASSRFVSNLNILPYRRQLGDGASVSAAPSASLVVVDGDVSARFGATLSANSGQKFGDRFNIQGQISALQSLDPEENGTQIFSSLAASYRISRNIQLETSYIETFDSNRDFGIALRGRVPFNEPRKYSQPKEGLGVLTGTVYFDRNRDGVRQEDEPGISNVRVQVSGTRLALNVDRDGLFTIQNIKEGLYGLVVDRRSLPLGLVVADDVSARATIAEGRITNLEIPIIASGQIRGAVFVDDNGNKLTDPGERRIEGTYIKLTSIGEDKNSFEPVTQIAASFGQYSFENLGPGQYELSVNYKGIVHTQIVELGDDNLFSIVPFALPSEGKASAPVSASEDEAPKTGLQTAPDFGVETIGEA